MSAAAHTSVPLRLNGAHNVRDLGGFSFTDPDGTTGTTAKGVFLRSGSLTRLTKRDRATLRAYGLVRVIDVRSNFELKIFPDPYDRRPEPGIDYRHVPMLDQLNSNGFQGLLPESMFAVYRDLLDEGQEGFRLLVDALDVETGCVLFHCRVGKDRTGVIAMLLLDLAGVAPCGIIADYAASERYMGGFLRIQRVGASLLARRIVPKCLFEANPSEMERTLTYLYERYGNARHFLVDTCGCDAATVERICRRLQGRAVC